MNSNVIRSLLITSALAGVCAATGCVADRPSRNGVFDENQYLRKDFLIQPGSGGTDPGWFMKTTIVSTSVPNPLAGSQASLATGIENGGSYVNFEVTSDKLVMNTLVEPSVDQTLTGSIAAQGTRIQSTIDSWPVTNVDLKYQVNLDGEKTNFYQENQELDWQQRQWVKLSFDKNDQSDLATYGSLTNEFLNKCTDVSNAAATLHPNSFYVDEVNNYFQFTVDVTLPILYNQLASTTVDVSGGTSTATTTYDTYCLDQFGYNGVMFGNLGRQNVTLSLMYSFARAPADPATSYDGGATAAKTYMPLVVPEKDNIQRKYGLIPVRQPAIDPSTGLWGSRQLVIRHDPNAAQITYYFAPGYPPNYKSVFGTPNDPTCIQGAGHTGCTYSDAADGSGIIGQTNKLFKIAGAKTKLVVMDYDAKLAAGQPPRQVGDVRYSFLRWMSDLSIGQSWLAVTQFVTDPRSGQLFSTSINVNDWQWQDQMLARLDYYEQTLGGFNFGAAGSPGTNGQGAVPATCQDGDTLPLVPATVASNHNGSSTLFAKMQQYLGKPVATWGNLGPTDFVVAHDTPFYGALATLLPYQMYADPQGNPYVTPEGGSANYGSAMAQMAAGVGEAQFQALVGQIDRGIAPFDVVADSKNGGQAGAAFLARLQQATVAHRDYLLSANYAHPYMKADDTSLYSLPGLIAKDARHCINGQWESRDQYVQDLITSFNASTVWHEFGHSLGLDHNFLASVDRANFPHYKDKSGRDHVGLYESSIMEYDLIPDTLFWSGAAANGGGQGMPGWAPYDQAAIAFIYANSSTSMASQDSGKPSGVVGGSVSGQSGLSLDQSGTSVTSANSRWKDPLGYCTTGTTASGFPCQMNAEIQYFLCTAAHMRYSPFCRQHDFGTTPSEIIAAEIDDYEWNYLWTNFPQYHQYTSFASYANVPAQLFTEGRRFLASWAFDWSQGELSDNFRRLGINPPAGIPQQTFYDDLSNQFGHDVSAANQLYAAASEGIILQSSGQRPYVTRFDPYFGDTIQQGIAIDKALSLQAFTALWPIDNYDQNQAAGSYLSSFSFAADPQYESVAEQATLAMVGGSYDMFAYAQPLGVQQFAMATHSTYYEQGATGGRPDMKDWIGGYVFNRQQDFLAFFRNLAVANNTPDSNGRLLCCPATGACNASFDTVDTCQYDPTIKGTPEDPAFTYHSDPYNQLVGPDYRRWIWVYLRDSNQWIVADRDRNVASFIIAYGYNADVLVAEDDGNIGNPYAIELQLKYMLNYFTTNGS